MSATPGIQPLDCDHGLRRQAIVESLLADIFRGKIRAGQHLVTRDLAERYGVSHTPIREAARACRGSASPSTSGESAIVRGSRPRRARSLRRSKGAGMRGDRTACGRIDEARPDRGPDSASRKADLRLDQPRQAVDPATWSSPATRQRAGRPHPLRGPKQPCPRPRSRSRSSTPRRSPCCWVAEGAEYQPHWSLIAPKRPSPGRERRAGSARRSTALMDGRPGRRASSRPRRPTA